MDDLIGSVIGGCRIESKIGQGGMGTVYKAHHEALDIPVAVKVLKPISDVPDAKERFMREARIAARLKHPNIVGVLNVGFEKNVHYIIMDYVDGKNLQVIITEKGRLPAEFAVRVSIQILQALQIALKNGIVHRDIKPENILIDKMGSAKLADLGLARIEGDMRLTMPNVMLGSPHYAPPEQTENPSAADARSDIYAMGCTLYHMLAGVTPFPGKSMVDVIVKHMNKPTPVLKDEIDSISPALSDVIYKMMQKDPNKRYQSPSEVIDALIAVYPQFGSIADSAPELLQKKKERFPGAAVLFMALLVIGCTCAILYHFTRYSGKNAVETPGVIKNDSLQNSDKSFPDTQRSLPVKKDENKKSKRRNLQSVSQVDSIGAQTNNTETPLLRIVKIGDTEALRKMLKAGASASAPAGAATSPLHEAVNRGLSQEAQLLLDYGADPNFRDSKGDAPLHYALRENAVFILTILLNKGANPNLTDSKGKRPVEIAEMIDSELVKLLQKYGGR
ncbi:MAG: protein kinase [Fibrobacter sp.]|nr:protein kinase [Fibrobacter sp.]